MRWRRDGLSARARRKWFWLLLLACLVALVAITVGITGYSISWTTQSFAGISSAAAAWLPSAAGGGGDSSMDGSASSSGLEHPASFLLGIAGDRAAGSSAAVQSAGSKSTDADEAAVVGQLHDGQKAAPESVGSNGSGTSAGHTSSADGNTSAGLDREEGSRDTSTGNDSPTSSDISESRTDGGTTGSTHTDVPDLPPADLSHLPPEIAVRCAGTVGDWCGRYLMQKPIPGKPQPPGSKRCPQDCNGVGVCQADFGYCLCPAGWTGEGCMERLLRPCTKGFRTEGSVPRGGSFPLSEEGWTPSRCAGVCDEERGDCYCNGTMGRIPAPEGSPPGTPPIRVGRPATWCWPKHDENGNEPQWVKAHAVDNELIWGPEGWCEAENPKHKCPCVIDGLTGPNCDIVIERACANQCSARGECLSGFCKCAYGWYGHDCGQRRADVPHGQDMTAERPWLKPYAKNPAAAEPPPKERLRPLIYVYDLPSDFNTRLLQYRGDQRLGFYRRWTEAAGNATLIADSMYLVETLFHEMLLQSQHRTFDMEEADYFYAPVYVNLYVRPVHGWADGPWFNSVGGPRVMHASNMMLQAKRWIEAAHPKSWRRRGGRDHIWLSPNDEGGCWVPNELWQGVILSHWGRLDDNPFSNSAYGPDNYSQPHTDEWQPQDWRRNYLEPSQHPCFDPRKDLLIPFVHKPKAYRQSPLQGAPPRERTILLFFRGDVGKYRLPNYSRGIRQKMHRLCNEYDWKEKYNIRIGAYDDDRDLTYGELMASSKFGLVAPGDGWASRLEDSLLHGTIPVIIQDGVAEKLYGLIDYAAISVRIAEADIERVPEILLAIPDERIAEMQGNIAKVWHRLQYGSVPLFNEHLHWQTEENDRLEGHGRQPPASMPEAFKGNLAQDDAFSTVVQWLYARMDVVHGI